MDTVGQVTFTLETGVTGNHIAIQLQKDYLSSSMTIFDVDVLACYPQTATTPTIGTTTSTTTTTGRFSPFLLILA